MVGFLSGGVSASFAGAFADRFGRKAACLAYCVIYSLSCLTLLSDQIVLLFLGRILGGISATLLYSVFESWLVAEFNGLMLEEQGSALSGIFSTMTTLNGLVAIGAGILAESLVGMVGTAKAPFMASAVCLSIAFITISKTWVSIGIGALGLADHDSRRTTALGKVARKNRPVFWNSKRTMRPPRSLR